MSEGSERDIRQLVYASVPVGSRAVDLDQILAQARRNNGMNGVSGLLVARDDRYVQILEGTPEAVGHIMDAIRDDDRHTDLRVISDDAVDERGFGGWTMAHLPGGREDVGVRRALNELLLRVPEPVKAAFALLD